jgi:aminoglycoside/choline kinase family phosphotransferase
MQHAFEAVSSLANSLNQYQVMSIDPLPQSGSDREYFRIHTAQGSLIGTFNLNIPENETFIYFSRHFTSKGLPVPQVIAINAEGTAYLQTDFGDTSLLQVLEKEGFTGHVKELFRLSLTALASLQVKGDAGLNYTKCLTAREFGKQAILSDLLYFKYYFLDTLKAPYDKQAMLDDFNALAAYLSKTEYKFFMFRDFQSRNIMIKDNKPWMIDFQGGMKGAPQYDAASMLWQARANLPECWKQELLSHYIDELQRVTGKKINREIFTSQFEGYVLIRLLQVLGAYGFRGLFERKAQFLSSIPQALRNLKWFIENKPLPVETPVFLRMLKYCVSDEVIRRFDPPKATEDTPLTVYINSFSYLKNGYPEDVHGNGGGFVFDCRGVLNPGRIDEYKTQCGTDKDVIHYLEQNTRMPEFLNSVFDMVDISVEDYLSRGFSSLGINFGCTGGQHRSVYAAEQTARHLRNKYKVRTVINHINRDNWRKTL